MDNHTTTFMKKYTGIILCILTVVIAGITISSCKFQAKDNESEY